MGDLALLVVLKAQDQMSSMTKSIFSGLKSGIGNLIFGFQNLGTSGTVGMDALKQGALGIGKSLLQIGAVAAVAGAALAVSIGTQAVKMAGDFQSGMTTLVTGAGEAKSNLKMVSDGILKVAVDTGTTTKQLTDGMYMIESSGQHGSKALDTLKMAAMGAKVGSASLAEVANGVTTEMTDYASSHLTAAQATNTLIATVAAGKTHMQDLTLSMSSILPTAAAMHVGLTDVSAAMATMTGEGTPAANAATYLRQMLTALENPAAKGVKALKQIGLSSSQVSDSMKKSLPDTLKLITDHLKKKFPEGSAAYIKALAAIAGGSKQMQGMLQLTGDHLQVFAGNVAGISDAVKRGGNSITGWNLVQQDFNQQLAVGQEVVETLMIRIGTALIPVITSLMAKVSPLIAQFSDWIEKNHVLDKAVGAIKTGIADAGIAIAVLKTGISDAVVAVQHIHQWFVTWHDVIQNTAIAITLFFTPALIRAGIEAAVSGGKIAVSFLATLVQTGVASVVNAAKVTGSFIASMVTAGAQAWVQGPKVLAGFVSSMVTSGTQAVVQGAKVTAQFVASMVKAGAEAVVQGAKVTAQFVASIVRSGVEAVVAAGKFVVSLIPAIISFAAQALAAAATAIPAMIAGLIAWAGAAWGAAAGMIAATWPILLIIAAIALLVVGIVLLVQHWSQVTAFLQGAWQHFTAWLQGALRGMEKFFTGIWDAIMSFLTGVWHWIVSTAKAMFLLLLTVILGPSVLIVAFVIAHWNQIKAAFFVALAYIQFVVQSGLHNVLTFFSQAGAHIRTAVQNIWNWINGILGGWPQKALEAGRALIQGLINGIAGMFGSVGATMHNLVNFVGSFLPHSPAKQGELSHLAEYGPNFVKGFSQGITGAIPTLKSSLNLLMQPVAIAVSAPLSQMPVSRTGIAASSVAPSPTSANSGVTYHSYSVVINGANASPKEIADEVEARLNFKNRRSGTLRVMTSGGRGA